MQILKQKAVKRSIKALPIIKDSSLKRKYIQLIRMQNFNTRRLEEFGDWYPGYDLF